MVGPVKLDLSAEEVASFKSHYITIMLLFTQKLPFVNNLHKTWLDLPLW